MQRKFLLGVYFERFKHPPFTFGDDQMSIRGGKQFRNSARARNSRPPPGGSEGPHRAMRARWPSAARQGVAQGRCGAAARARHDRSGAVLTRGPVRKPRSSRPAEESGHLDQRESGARTLASARNQIGSWPAHGHYSREAAISERITRGRESASGTPRGRECDSPSNAGVCCIAGAARYAHSTGGWHHGCKPHPPWTSER